MKINFYTGDLPASFKASNIIAFDSETMGLNPKRDKLCLVQISNGDEVCHLVKIDLSNEKPLNLIKIASRSSQGQVCWFCQTRCIAVIMSGKVSEKESCCTLLEYVDSSGDT